MRSERSKLYCFFGETNMALIKYGGGIVQMSGSIAGTVFARNKSGNYARPRTKPVNPKSVRQEAIRAIISFLAEMWHADMTAVQRGLWETYAAAVPMKNKLGETIHLSGFNMFIRTSCASQTAGLGFFDDAPTILSLPEKDVDLVCSEEDVAGQTFTFTCAVGGWAPNGDPKGRILLYQGQPQLVSRQTFHGPWRYMGNITPIEGAAGTSTDPAAFSFAVGQKVWFQARVITTTGRLSELWQLDPRTIVADP